MALPTLTPEQRQEALKKAAAARTARKELRDAIARGDETIPAVLGRAKTDAVVGKTKVADLLKSLPGYGPAKVTALLEQTGIDASRRAAGLGDRQKQALVDLQHRSEQRGHFCDLGLTSGEYRFQFVELLLRCVLAGEARGALELLDDGI